MQNHSGSEQAIIEQAKERICWQGVRPIACMSNENADVPEDINSNRKFDVTLDGTLLSQALCKSVQNCWMLHVASVCSPCCMLLRVVGSYCAKFETGQTFSYVQTDATTPNIVGSCWPTILRLFSRGFKFLITGIREFLHRSFLQ